MRLYVLTEFLVHQYIGAFFIDIRPTSDSLLVRSKYKTLSCDSQSPGAYSYHSEL